MKLGYPCINNSIGCTANSTFRLKSYSEEVLKEKVRSNLDCLMKTLEFNKTNNLLFFRIGSPLVPFASHPVNTFNWQDFFKNDFKKIGDFIKQKNFRISMHPDQFVLINSPNPNIVNRSIKELEYHCQVLDLMGLDESAKVQIHVGGVYNNKPEAIQRFIENYIKLPDFIKKRLAIENDERMFSLKDCVSISEKTGIPIIFDFFHHACLNNKETIHEAIKLASSTWKSQDGLLMTDYSSQSLGERKGKHIQSINISDFKNTINQVKEIDFDVMLEIKDKEKSAIKALNLLVELEKIK